MCWGTAVYGKHKLHNALILGCPCLWECIPMYWGCPAHRKAFPYPSIWECIPIYLGTPTYGIASPWIRQAGINSHILGRPSIWQYIPMCWGIPVYGKTSLCIGVLQYMGLHPHKLDAFHAFPYILTPMFGKAFLNTGVPQFCE